jgi:hypothetical protein
MLAFRVGDPGSNPGRGSFKLCLANGVDSS